MPLPLRNWARQATRAEAAFTVAFAGPLVTLQDVGRPGHTRFGVPASGAMDRLAFDAANAAIGTKSGQKAVEISLGGLMLQSTKGAMTVAIAAGDFTALLGSQKTSSWTILTVQKSERLSIAAGKAGSGAYLAFAGRTSAAEWLGNQATHSTFGLGGGAVRSGQPLPLSDTSLREDRPGDIAKPVFQTSRPLRVVTGPQDPHFAKETVAQFLAGSFAVSDAYDRMGMRLKEPEQPLVGALSIPWEAIARGSVQVSGDGVPTVLLADHQTTGGYPKIATVISPDIDRLVQQRAGQSLQFAIITSAQAVAAARSCAWQKAA